MFCNICTTMFVGKKKCTGWAEYIILLMSVSIGTYFNKTIKPKRPKISAIQMSVKTTVATVNVQGVIRYATAHLLTTLVPRREDYDSGLSFSPNILAAASIKNDDV